MKAKIHPQYFENLKIVCSCGNVIIAGSTRQELKTEICSACHPFYTGQQKLIDTAGRVDKFLAKVKKAQQLKEKSIKVIDQELEEIFEHKKKPEAPGEEAPAKKSQPKKPPAAPKTAKKSTAKKTAAKKSTAKKK